MIDFTHLFGERPELATELVMGSNRVRPLSSALQCMIRISVAAGEGNE